MSKAKVTNARRKRSVRLKLRRSGGGRPRLSVFRSSKHIYAQVIDDLKGETLASASSLEKSMRDGGKTGADIDAAKAVGKLLAERAAPRRASRKSCSIAAATSTTGASRHWPTLRVRAG
ncbi:large subunit ribosomal protein L18 [Bradyrhizobium sp. i1.4.4]